MIPSPKLENDSAEPRNECDTRKDSQQRSPPAAAPAVRRPSVEKLDPAEVKKAFEVADLLAKPGLRTAAAAAAAEAVKKTKKTKSKSEEVKKPVPAPPVEFIPRPPPVPFSDGSNPDAAALRAATSLLQMQKAKGAHDIQTLEQLRELNRKDPLAFMKQIVAGKMKATGQTGIIGPTLGPGLNDLISSIDLEAPDGKRVVKGAAETEKTGTGEALQGGNTDIPPFPVPQNIIRTPAINWAKYGIVGDTLDKMHEEQRTNPSLGEPEKLATRHVQPTLPVAEQLRFAGEKAPEFVIAAPYNPLKDDIKTGPRKPL